MDRLYIEGNHSLNGMVRVQGSKNASLPILAAALLIDGVTTLTNCPKITDVDHMINLLRDTKSTVQKKENQLFIETQKLCDTLFTQRDVNCMRCSILMLGAMLGREKKICLDYPGGCIIGERPVDIHIHALQKLGANIEITGERIEAECGKHLGGELCLPFPSVGATQNIILYSVLAKGVTKLHNCAKEPEVVSMCSFLNQAGANISGIGTSDLLIEGVKELKGISYEIPPDRIVAGTYLFTVAACGGELVLENAPVKQLYSPINILSRMGCVGELDCEKSLIHMKAPKRLCSILGLKTDVYPGFPTDLQSILLTALTTADGQSEVEEQIFENRFIIAPELKKMGANIECEHNLAKIKGVCKLHGEKIEAKELRGCAALVCAGLMAEGKTILSGISFLQRGYEDLPGDIKELGGKIEWI